MEIVDRSCRSDTQATFPVAQNEWEGCEDRLPSCHEPGKSISAQPFISAPFSKGIKVDGKQDDWKNVPAVTGLIAPWDGAEKDKTAFYACHDQKNLYFLYECLILLWFIMTRRRRLLSVMETGSSFL